MPNRIIKESICTSEDIAKLSIEAEVLFYRLIVNADDYGCYFGNPSLVKSRCFPLKSDDIHSEQVDAWLDELANAGLIIRYTAADERDYCQFVKWNAHQRVRQSEHKYPQYDASCCELRETCGNSPQVAATRGKVPPNPIQSNPIQNPIQSESNIESNPKGCSDEHADVFAKFSAGDEVLLLALKDFEKMRTRIKKPMTDKARELLTRKLQEFKREEWVDVLNQSVYQGWAGIYPINTDKEKKRGKKVVTFMDV